jgi:Arc/MetJ-type ribon-helix-helix transcriptional regulator
MTISLLPKVEGCLQAKVQAGEFSTPDAVIEAALSQMMESAVDRLDADELPTICESLAQMKRGEAGDWKQLSSELRAKYL